MPNLWRISPGTYQGLEMRCAPGVHEAAMGMLQSQGVRPASVLDLASGSGAMLQRLSNNGIGDLNAVELDTAAFRFAGVQPMSIDLNGEFSRRIGRRFGLVVAIEIIEHLDSPRQFVRQIHELLEPGGYLLLSTPNIADWLGRLKFLRTGDLRYFDEPQYRFNHHISPIPDTQMRLMLQELGFELVEARSAGSFAGPLQRLASIAPRLILGLIGARRTPGEVNLYLASALDTPKIPARK